MRIVDEWTTDDIRCTVMIMNGRYSLKVEKDLLEQTYKFRDGQIESLEHLRSMLTDNFYQDCKRSFSHMDISRAGLLPDAPDESFPELI